MGHWRIQRGACAILWLVASLILATTFGLGAACLRGEFGLVKEYAHIAASNMTLANASSAFLDDMKHLTAYCGHNVYLAIAMTCLSPFGGSLFLGSVALFHQVANDGISWEMPSVFRASMITIRNVCMFGLPPIFLYHLADTGLKVEEAYYCLALLPLVISVNHTGDFRAPEGHAHRRTAWGWMRSVRFWGTLSCIRKAAIVLAGCLGIAASWAPVFHRRITMQEATGTAYGAAWFVHLMSTLLTLITINELAVNIAMHAEAVSVLQIRMDAARQLPLREWSGQIAITTKSFARMSSINSPLGPLALCCIILSAVTLIASFTPYRSLHVGPWLQYVMFCVGLNIVLVDSLLMLRRFTEATIAQAKERIVKLERYIPDSFSKECRLYLPISKEAAQVAEEKEQEAQDALVTASQEAAEEAAEDAAAVAAEETGNVVDLVKSPRSLTETDRGNGNENEDGTTSVLNAQRMDSAMSPNSSSGLASERPKGKTKTILVRRTQCDLDSISPDPNFKMLSEPRQAGIIDVLPSIHVFAATRAPTVLPSKHMVAETESVHESIAEAEQLRLHCMRGHLLQYRVSLTSNRRVLTCDPCRVKFNGARGSWGCRPCSFYVCLDCADKEVVLMDSHDSALTLNQSPAEVTHCLTVLHKWLAVLEEQGISIFGVTTITPARLNGYIVSMVVSGIVVAASSFREFAERASYFNS